MGDPNDLDEKFEYDGRLVFNGIFIETESSPYNSKEELLSELSEFTEGTPGEPGFGFKDLQLGEWAERYSEIPPELLEITDDVWDIEYRRETYDLSEDLVDEQGDPVDGFVSDDWSAYVYWYPDEFLILQASKSKLEDLEEKLFPTIGRSHFESEQASETDDNDTDGNSNEGGDNGDGEGNHPHRLFHPEFLQWLVWKYDTTGHANGLELVEFSDASMSGDLSNFGKRNDVGDSRDITKSHPIIAGMLDDRDFEKLEGIFKVDDVEVDAQLWRDGRIRVMAQEDVGDASDYGRVLITNKFLREFLDVYLEWRSMDPTRKYVHPDYFELLHERAKNLPRSATYDFDFNALVQRYAHLRGENPADYNTQFNI
ncbi:hypothetical protein EXE41_04730 [Halorubrum sp. SD690R]|uniref:hypothetical protein n=1 Tax=Halorubrum sp. SD690R TaxID=2518117 RepID=UPI0010F6E53E|nr:hypothetical protein [Halorubrum sp. SD690R]TKX47533.1 hypothetical protein EXE41_04730 [Halorubrum sp. SD690R]